MSALSRSDVPEIKIPSIVTTMWRWYAICVAICRTGIVCPFWSERMLQRDTEPRAGKIRYGLAAMLLGLPLPIVIIAFLWGGCGT